MTFQVSRKALADELALLQIVAEKKGTLPVLSTVMMDIADDQLTLYATNLDASIVTRLPASGEPWTGCLPMVELAKFVRLAEPDSLSFQVKDTRMQIKAGKAKCQLPSTEREHFPSLPEPAGASGLSLPGEALRTALTRLLPCVSAEQSRYTMRGIKFEAKNGTLRLVATDNSRMGMVLLAVEGEIDTLVPADGLAPLLKTTAETVVMNANVNQASFECDHRLVTTRLIDGKFPSWETIWPKEMPYQCEVTTDAITTALRRVEITRNPMRDSAIHLTFEGQSILIDSNATDRGQCDELLEVVSNLNGEKILVGVNPDYLGDFLRHAAEKVKCEFKDSNNVIKLSDGSTFEYIVMPMRI